MSSTGEDFEERRRRLCAEYPQLYEAVEALLFRHDPVGVNLEVNTDEYSLEVGMILPRLRGCASAEDVCEVVHKVFVQCFDTHIAGRRERYSQISKEIWELWRKFATT